jgi:lipid biosynthesis B12-binding/radical SAM protein
MKILLISSNTAESPYPIYPIGMSIVSSALVAAGHDVHQYDFLMEQCSLESLKHKVREFAPELIGISIRNIDNVNLMNEELYIDTVRDIVEGIRKVSDSRILLGGAGFSLMPDLILERTGADYGIVGEGEQAAVEFAEQAARGIYPDQPLVGPAQRLQGGSIVSPFYDENLVMHYLQSGNIASVQTKRGCTHKCVYCTYPVLEGSEIRQRDTDAIIEDIRVLSDKHKAKYIFFVDSVFNDDGGAYLKLLEAMERKGVCIPWTGFFKPKGLNDEIVALMKRTGLIAVEIGSDAACDRTLKKMGKGFSFQDIIDCNELFARHDIATSHYFMFGGPGETEDTVAEGIENIKGLKKCVSFIFMGIRILPDTALARIALKEKVISDDSRMLDPLYYISPHINRAWLEETLTRAFAEVRHCVFPPDTFDNSLRLLHKMGYIGTLWDLLLPGRKPPAGRKRAQR